MRTIEELRKDIRKQAHTQKAKQLTRYFQAFEGGYGQGDKFFGLTVPICRAIAKQYTALSLPDIQTILISTYHEERLIALLLLMEAFKKGNEKEKKRIVDLYKTHTTHINNWDLVDLSAPNILGAYAYEHQSDILRKMAHSSLLWERRMSIVATYYLIKKGKYKDTIHIACLLLSDSHDLIQKAVGWMLREMGKNGGQKELIVFIQMHYESMPRTMLRYAIEKFDKETRLAYLKGTFKQTTI